MERFRLEVGNIHGVKPGNIVGAIANEAEIDSEHIGRIEIYDDFSTVDLPEGMPKELFKHLKSVWVSGQRLQISRLADDNTAPLASPGEHEKRSPGKARPKDKNKGKPKAKGRGKSEAAGNRERRQPEAAASDKPSSKPAVRRRPAK